MLSKLVFSTFIIQSFGLMTEIKQGNVGVKYSQGIQQPGILEPGWHFYLNIYSKIEHVDIRYQNDEFSGIKCGSRNGNLLMFDKIMVKNRLDKPFVSDVLKRFSADYEDLLIKDVIEAAVQESCSEYTQDEIYTKEFQKMGPKILNKLIDYQKKLNSNLEILQVVVQKPKIKEEFQKHYDAKTEEDVKIQTQKKIQERVLKEAETETLKLKAEATRKKEIAEINKQASAIDNERFFEKEKKEAEGKKYKADLEAEAEKIRIEKIAEANLKLHTDRYMQEHWQANVLKEVTAVFGDKIPTYMALPDLQTKNE